MKKRFYLKKENKITPCLHNYFATTEIYKIIILRCYFINKQSVGSQKTMNKHTNAKITIKNLKTVAQLYVTKTGEEMYLYHFRQ